MLVSLLSGPVTGRARELHVSPRGEDSNIGTTTSPLRTLAAAQAMARMVTGREPVTVVLHDGVYYLEKTLVMTSRDSGTKVAPVIYRAAKGSKPVVSGGLKLNLAWKPHQGRILQAETPPGTWIDQLFVSGNRQPMARYPNYDPEAKYYNGASADAFSPQRAARWADPAGGFIHAMHAHHWGGYHYRITGKNADNTVTYEGGWQNNRQLGMHKQHRFVENIFEELDAPGEWFHNAKTGTLYYYPAADVDMKTAVFEVARLRHLVELRGSQAKPVAHLTLQGLIFRHVERTFMETREPLLRSDWTIYRGGAVVISGAEDCSITDCEFDQVGGNAVFVDNYNRRITVRGTHIHGAGASGVCFVGDPDAVRDPLFEYGQRQNFADIDKTPGPRTDNYPDDCLVEDCLIHTVSVVEKQAAGIQISMSHGVTVRHCSIYDIGRAGINISEGTFGGHLIEYCDVFDTVRETGDHGSFNSWGRDRFWYLGDAPEDQLPELAKLDAETNIIRNSRWRCDHGWDIDLDDGSSNYRVYNNLLLNGGLKFREGFNRVAENNIMVGNSFHPHVWYPNSQDIVRNNIVFTEYKPIRVPKPWGKLVDHNFWHQPDVSVPRPATHLQGQSGRDQHSIIADAMFVDPESGDYRVKEGSPALKLGFENFPMDRFGVRKPELKSIARTPKLPSGQNKLTPVAAPMQMTYYWLQATVRTLVGEEFSAFGVDKDSGGVRLASVPRDSEASRLGFKSNDVVQVVDGKPTKTIADLYQVRDAAAGKPLVISLVRSQQKQTLSVDRYTFVQNESSESGSFKLVPLSEGSRISSPGSIESRPATVNQPLSALLDGELAENYGPVFPNGVTTGRYRIDLGESRSLSVINTWSFNQNGTRGRQSYTLFGSNSATDPGWQVDDRSNFDPIAVVHPSSQSEGKFRATRIRTAGDRSLGTYRWLIWQVHPVTAIRENSSYQEVQVGKLSGD
ncbi:MAG: signaling protein [Fuerstiella sp.]|nr:signaling protein [Fuerstiella sp.]MCP4858172.1 signaling protein [Fuerstiella sp.]